MKLRGHDNKEKDLSLGLLPLPLLRNPGIAVGMLHTLRESDAKICTQQEK